MVTPGTRPDFRLSPLRSTVGASWWNASPDRTCAQGTPNISRLVPGSDSIGRNSVRIGQGTEVWPHRDNPGSFQISGRARAWDPWGRPMPAPATIDELLDL